MEVAATGVAPTMTIGGAATAGSSSYPVIDPATEATIGAAPECTPEQLDRAVAAARRAYRSWASDEGARRGTMSAAADALDKAEERIGELLTAEQGKPLKAAAFEVRELAGTLRWFADLDTTPPVLHDDEHARVELRRRPIGTVAAITPWNFPLALAGYKLAPALLAGNTIVLKPAPSTPLATLAVGALLADVLPPGVLNVISGREPLGAQLVAHADVDKVTFTGSVATGRHVALAAAADFKRATLELGGNDAAIILDDVDVDQTVRRMFWGAFENNGQACMAIKRVYAPRRLYDDIVAAFAERASTVRVGDGREPDVHLGPVHSREQLDRVAALLDDALAAGARVVAGGSRLGDRGFFHAPTIVADAADGMALVDDEQFGPALPIVAYDDESSAIAAANGTQFGLGASVWSADAARAEAVGAEIEAGTVWINAHLRLGPWQPFGGVKCSGVGLENGKAGWEAFTAPQVHHLARG